MIQLFFILLFFALGVFGGIFRQTLNIVILLILIEMGFTVLPFFAAVFPSAPDYGMWDFIGPIFWIMENREELFTYLMVLGLTLWIGHLCGNMLKLVISMKSIRED